MKLLFVVNPISGGINKEPFLKQAAAFCHKYAIDYKVFKTTGKDDETRLKKELIKYLPDRVLAVGGDGTTLFTSIVLQDTGLPMGIIPLGSANGMATELFVHNDPIEALKDAVMSNVAAGLDMVVVNKHYPSIHIGDVGINARIIEAYEKDKNRGMVTYAKYFIKELQNLEPFDYSVTTNEKTVTGKALMVGICNARKYGTGVPLNITGNPMDGKFEIVIVEEINLSSLIKAGLSKFNENFHDSQYGKIISTDKAEISFNKPRLLQLDGELIGNFQELTVDIVKSAVNLITHNENTYLK